MKLVKKGKKGIIWVLIYTKAKQEKKANENLQRQGFKTFLPLIVPTNKNSEFNSPVPDDFSDALKKWRQYAQHKNL